MLGRKVIIISFMTKDLLIYAAKVSSRYSYLRRKIQKNCSNSEVFSNNLRHNHSFCQACGTFNFDSL